MSESLHEMLNVGSWKATERFVAQGRVLRDARTSELLQSVRVRGEVRDPTSSAARRHLALATSWVVPCNSGTCKERENVNFLAVRRYEKANLLSRSCESISIGTPWERIYLVSINLFAFPVTKAKRRKRSVVQTARLSINRT